jgi:hypothetical protein
LSPDSRDGEGKLGAWLGARWQWLVVGVLLLFALNKLVGLIVASLGLITFANGIAGRLLGARRVVQQVQELVRDPDDPAEDA